MDDLIVYIRSTHSKIHRAVVHDGVYLSAEGCNLDALIGERRVFYHFPEDAEPGDFCERCFKPPTGMDPLELEPAIVIQGQEESVTL
jgi:hypothetical protein